VFGGIFRDEAIMLLRRFYVQENDKGLLTAMGFFMTWPMLTFLAPEPSKKKNRELKTEILPMGVAASVLQ